MPIETEVPRSNRDRIYDNIDRKAGIVSDLWRTATILPIPLLSDAPELINTEARVLRGIIGRASDRMPNAFDAYYRYQALEGTLDGLSTSTDLTEQEILDVQYEMNQAELTEDFDFAQAIVEGVEALITRRADLRRMQEEVGEPQSNGVYENPMVFDGVIEGMDIRKSAVTRVIMGAYSVNLYLYPSEYQRIVEPKHPNASGMHLDSPNSLFSIIEDSDAVYVTYFNQPPDKFNERLQKTLQHEEFHGFVDAFRTAFVHFEELQKDLVNQAVLITNAIGEGNYSLTKVLLDQARKMIEKVPDASVEELLAEMAESENRDSIPVSTFAYDDKEKRQLLESVSTHSAMRHIDVDREAGKLIDIAELRSTIGWIYYLADQEIPEKRGEVDALFALFPPSKIRHIRRVVERWIVKKATVKELD